MKDENQKKEKKVKTGSIKIDAVSIGCIFLILLLTLIAVLPPMLRIYLPEKSEEESSSNEKNDVLESNAIIVCIKSSNDGSVTTTLNEEYQLKDGRLEVARLRETSKMNEGSNTTQDELANLCMEKKREVDDLSGVSVSCERQNGDTVRRNQEIRYELLDYYTVNSIAPNFKIDFEPNTKGIDIQKQKQQAGYTCSVN